MARREWGRFSDTGFDLFVTEKGQTSWGSPVRSAIIFVTVFLALAAGIAFLIVRYRPGSSPMVPVIGAFLMGQAFFNSTYRLYDKPEARHPIPVGFEIISRFREVRVAGMLYLIGSLFAFATDPRLLAFSFAVWLCAVLIYVLRIMAIGRAIRSHSNQAEPQVDRSRA